MPREVLNGPPAVRRFRLCRRLSIGRWPSSAPGATSLPRRHSTGGCTLAAVTPAMVRQLRHHFGIFLRVYFSAPHCPHTPIHMLYLCTCCSGADWCLESDAVSNLGLQGAVTSRPAPASTSLMHGARTTTLCVLPLPIRTPYAGGLQGELGCLQRKVGLRALRCGMKAWGLPMLYHGHPSLSCWQGLEFTLGKTARLSLHTSLRKEGE